MIEHSFTPEIKKILYADFNTDADSVLEKSELLQYLNLKTKSVSRGSKARSSFGNIYAVYVLIEDYIKQGFQKNNKYKEYEGARFSDLLKRIRELPFGQKIQNHSLNHRMNEEFKKFFPTCEYIPILRDHKTKQYWINENLLNIKIGNSIHNIACVVNQIIDSYIEAKKSAFESFVASCRKIQKLKKNKPSASKEFINNLIQPNVDARIFEIVTFAILKQYYQAKAIYWGWSENEIHEDALILYKTGRTNANDGGIDFVMKPLGRFFQVTETIDVHKYFLDIDKVQRYPITFVIKSTASVLELLSKIRDQASKSYNVAVIVERYMECIEEIINIPILLERLEEVSRDKKLSPVIDEIVLQSKLEFNF